MVNKPRTKATKDVERKIKPMAHPGTAAFFMPQPSRLTSSPGFTLVELIGVMAILAILASVLSSNVINQMRNARRDAESHQLANIGQGIELYLRQTKSFPANLAILSPDYVAGSPGQLTNNHNGFLRYYFVQPNISGYTNAAGLAPAALADSRFLLITDLSQNANPTIITDADFETWWNTDETGTPDRKIHRGHVGHLFHLLSLSADGAGGSYAIDGTATNAGAGTLAAHTRYHITGTIVALDDANTFVTPETQFIMTREAGYRFDPDCTTGSQWRIIRNGCLAS